MGKTIAFDMVASFRGRGKVYQDSEFCVLVDVDPEYVQKNLRKILVLRSEITHIY